MKRDMELVRKILLALEEHEHGRAPRNLVIESYSDDQVYHHVYLMAQAGLVKAADITTTGSNSSVSIPSSLAWAGHDFLATAKDDTIWAKAKKKAKDKGLELGELGFGVVAEYLKQQIKEQLGLSPV